MINIGVRVKNQVIRVLIKIIICEILARVIVNVIRRLKLTNIQISKNFHTKKVCLINQHDENKIRVNEKSHKNIAIHQIEYVAVKDFSFKKNNGVNPL